MLIVIPKDSLLPLLFPGLPASAEEQDILRALRKQYTIGDYTPNIQIKGQQVVIDFDESKAQAAEQTHQRIIALSEKGQYVKARKLLEPIIQKGTINSGIHRIYGQILYDEGQPEAAMDSLIEALRWDPKNTAALIMVGNLYAQVQNDTETALQFFERAVNLDPKDHVALNNMAGLLAKQGKRQEAMQHFQRVLELEPNYPQAAYGIALLHDQEGELLSAFDWAIRALKASTGEHQQLAPTCVQLAQQIAQAYLEATPPESLYQPYLDALAAHSPMPIRVEENTDIPNIAKILVAEYRNIDAHTVQYQPGAPFATHLIMHELGHLDLILEARRASENQLFTSNRRHEQQFQSRTDKDRRRMLKAGLAPNQAEGFLNHLFRGINSQLYNAPLDLFIEQRLYDHFPALRPIQFLSLRRLYQDAIDGANNKRVGKHAPNFVRNANITLSYVLLLQYRDLYGWDLTSEIREPLLLRKAERLYEDYLNMKDDKQPGEEYDLIEWWSEELMLQPFFALEKEVGQEGKVE